MKVGWIKKGMIEGSKLLSLRGLKRSLFAKVRLFVHMCNQSFVVEM